MSSWSPTTSVWEGSSLTDPLLARSILKIWQSLGSEPPLASRLSHGDKEMLCIPQLTICNTHTQLLPKHIFYSHMLTVDELHRVIAINTCTPRLPTVYWPGAGPSSCIAIGLAMLPAAMSNSPCADSARENQQFRSQANGYLCNSANSEVHACCEHSYFDVSFSSLSEP